MPKISSEKVQERKDEILDACASLYQKTSYRNVTMKDIATFTSFSRPSIYNYFQTIEEIFLGLITRETNNWAEDLRSIAEHNETLSAHELASAVAHTLEQRETMLRILSTNFNEIEDNSRPERLLEYKAAMQRVFEAFDVCLHKFLPKKSTQECFKIRFQFFPYLHGVYPYSHITEKQKEAMDKVGTPHPKMTVYDLTYSLLSKLFQ